MHFVADLHLHSKYSRATSANMNVPTLVQYAKMKGIDMLGTGDITHPIWIRELKKILKEVNYGSYEYNGISFVLTGEVSNIFHHKGQLKKVHNIVFLPSFEIAEKLQVILSKYTDLMSDGRPMLSMSAADFLSRLLELSEDNFIVPAHAWTPWFSIFGSNSGFDSIDECFGKLSDKIFSIETGLSSDPPMNWRLSSLDRITLISNSDSHSPAKIGREANVFLKKINYKELKEILEKKDKTRFLYTIEFFPEEGKYHLDGHRACNVRSTPEETKQHKGICPKCGKKVTIGVMNRVDALADMPSGTIPSNAISYKRLVPLAEIISAVKGVGVDSIAVKEEYNKIVNAGTNELNVLLNMSLEELKKIAQEPIAKAIKAVREEKVKVQPGYDGVYGIIEPLVEKEPSKSQLSLF